MKFILKLQLLFLVLIPLNGHTVSKNCGNLLGTYFKLTSDGQVTLDRSQFSKTHFCDEGQDEFNANFKFELLDAGKIITSKNVFIPEKVFHEILEPKTGKIKLLKKPRHHYVQKLIKFSIPKITVKELKFKVHKLSGNKLVGEGVLPLNRP